MSAGSHVSLPQVVADAFRAALPLDLRAVRELLEAAGGGQQVLYASAGLEVRVEALESPGPGTLRAERADVLYVVLEGSGILGVEDGDPLPLTPGEAVVIPAGTRHVVFGNPRLSLLVAGAPGWKPVAPLAVCRTT